MKQKIELSRQSVKFINKNKISKKEIISYVIKAVKKFNDKEVNINIKKLKGQWQKFHRITIGNIRIIVNFDFRKRLAYIYKIDFRGDAYK